MVRGERGGTGNAPNSPLTETSSSDDGFIPKVRDGLAEEDRAENRPARPGEDESHQAVVEGSEEAVGEDAEVLQQDGEFRQEEPEVVNDNAGPEGFEGVEGFVFC